GLAEVVENTPLRPLRAFLRETNKTNCLVCLRISRSCSMTLATVLKAASVTLLVLTTTIPVLFSKASAKCTQAFQTGGWRHPHEAPVYDLAWSGDGSRLPGAVDPYRGNTCNLVTFGPGSVIPSDEIQGVNAVTCVAVEENGALLVGTDAGGVFRLVDVQVQL